MRLADLPTPCLVLDRAALRRNAQRVQATASALGLALRIDMQAARSIDIARLAFGVARDAGAVIPGISVATLADGEYFAAYDVPDILYATCITPDRLDQLAKLGSAGAAILAATDDPATARAIAAHPAALRVLVRVDAYGTGGGLAAEDPALAEIAAHLGPRLAGLMTEAPCPAVSARPGALAAVIELLAGLGHASGLVSSDDVADAAPGPLPSPVTEWRAGSCLFADQALTVLARVTGRDPGGASVRLDAGAVALGGMGVVGELLDREASFGRTAVRALWLEQSLARAETLPGKPLPAVGEAVRVLPLHACLAAAAHDRYFVVDGSDEVAAVWPRVGGW